MGQIYPYLLIMFLTFNTFALNIPTANITPLSAWDERRCWPKEWMFSKSPEFSDCNSAIDQLPRYEGFGAFHIGDPDDPYKLPVEKTSGTCTLRVELRGSSRVACAWPHIITTSRILNIKCFSFMVTSQAASVEIACGINAQHTGRVFATLQYPGLLDHTENLTIA